MAVETKKNKHPCGSPADSSTAEQFRIGDSRGSDKAARDNAMCSNCSLQLPFLGSPNNRGVAALPLADARFRRQIGVLTWRDARLPPLAGRFIQILRELPD